MRPTSRNDDRARIRRACAALLAAASGLAFVPCQSRAEGTARTADFVAVYAARGASSILGYVSSSWYAATIGARAGQPLYVLDIASLRGGPMTGGGILLGAQRGIVTGSVEVSHASMATAAQSVYVEATGSAYDPAAGYTDIASSDVRFPARYLEVSTTALFINGNVAVLTGPVEPYLGAGIGASVMTVRSRVVSGIDGGKLSETRVGIALQAAAGVRVVPGGAFFGWLEFRPGWHVMGPFEKGVGYDRTRDQFILQLLPVVGGVGWMWQ